MAVFSNQATLRYSGGTTNSNIVYGQLLEVLEVTKTAVEGSYTPGDRVTYVVTLRNTGTTALTGLTLTDDLGAYAFGETTVYPLVYEADSIKLFADGEPQGAPGVTAGPPLTVTGITVSAGGSTAVVYQALVTEYASPAQDGSITNTVTVTGDGLTAPVTGSETLAAAEAAALSVTKSVTPTQVVDNSRLTYTFVIQNTGNTPLNVTDNAVITDTFDPILTALAVTFEGSAWTQGTQYTYDETTGLFATAQGAIVVAAATYTRDPDTGAYTVTPGVATLTVTGTV